MIFLIAIVIQSFSHLKANPAGVNFLTGKDFFLLLGVVLEVDLENGVEDINVGFKE